jgi:tetratricopeptide (TPR) repeat protein
VGKRSLVSAFLKSIPPGEAMVLRSAARAATRDTPFSIVADLSRDMLGLAEGAEPKEILKRLQMTAAMLYPGEADSREVRALVQAVGMLLGVKLDDDEAQIDAEERRQRISAALRRIKERLSKDQPLVICVEDVHWADSASWEVFLELLRASSDRPILGIATARPDDRVLDAATDANTVIITLDELGADERVRLVMDRFAPEEDQAALRGLADEIVSKAGGNPFFLGETVEALIERGILAESPKHAGKLVWVRKDAPVQVPTSVEALVQTRLDRLPHAEKETLTRAAVIGRVFAPADVSALVGRAVDEELAGLASRGLIDTAPSGYTFRNELTLRVAYDLLPPDERAQHHRRAAGRMLDSPAYRTGQDDAVIARHLELAGDGAAAARRYLSAAMHALDVRGSAEAFRHFTSALALLPKAAHAERFSARAEREAILRAQARRPQQLREIHHMRREAEALGDSSKVALALSRLAQLYMDVGKTPAARRTLGPALDAARKAGDRLAEAGVLRLEAALSRSIGKNAEALELCARALTLCGEDKPGFLERAQILNIRGTALWNMSRLREAIEAYAEALVIYRKLRAPRQEARALNNMGIVFSALGEYEEAIAHYKRSLKIDTELGDRAQIGLKLANIGQTYLDLGELERAEQYLVKALSLAEQVRDPGSSTDGTITLGQVYLKRGDATRAKTLFERGLDMATQNRTRYQEIRALVYLALAQLQCGDPPSGALDLARSATRLAHAAPMPIGEIYGIAVEALAMGALGTPGEAADRARDAVQLMDATRDPEGAEEILWIHAKLARAAGRDAEAKASLGRARHEVDSKAKRLRDPALRARFLASPPARDIAAAESMS